jgi:hypothetical protein
MLHIVFVHSQSSAPRIRSYATDVSTYQHHLVCDEVPCGVIISRLRNYCKIAYLCTREMVHYNLAKADCACYISSGETWPAATLVCVSTLFAEVAKIKPRSATRPQEPQAPAVFPPHNTSLQSPTRGSKQLSAAFPAPSAQTLQPHFTPHKSPNNSTPIVAR